MTRRTIVAVYSDTGAAYAAAEELKKLSKDGNLDFTLKAGALFRKDDRGNIVPIDEKERPLWGTLAGGAAGALVGLLAGPAGAVAGATIGAAGGLTVDAVGAAFDEDFVEEVAREVRPGEVAAVAEVDEGSPIPVDGAIRAHGGRVYRSNV